MGWILEETRAAGRALLAAPGFSALVIAVLAAGLGCVLFMFAIINGLMLRPLPFERAEQLYMVGTTEIDGDELDSVIDANLVDFQRRYADIAEIAGVYAATVNLSDAGRPERFDGAVVTGDLFALLRVQPALGRDFTTADQVAGAPLTVMLSDALWRSRYGADPKVIGREIRANAQVATVIGVMPPRFSFPEREVVWLPARLDATRLDTATSPYFDVVARVRDGHTVAELEAAHRAWFEERKAQAPSRVQGIEPLVIAASHYFIDQETRSLMGAMFAAVVLVLLIGSANAANLFLVRVLGRRQELALRAALGASRARLTVNVMVQAFVLAIVAASLSLPIAQWFVHATISSYAASDQGPPGWLVFDVDATGVAFTFTVAIVTALIVGSLPAWRTGADMNTALRDGGRGNTGSAFGRVSRALVVGEIALSCVLLISAGALVRIVREAAQVDTGVRGAEQLLTARVALFDTQFPTPASQRAAFRDLRERVRGDAVVIDAGMGDALPGLSSSNVVVAPDGFEPGERGFPEVAYATVDERFTSAYGIAIEAGRGLLETDTETSQPVALVDREFADRYFPGQSAIGRTVKLSPQQADGRTVTIVGITRDLQLEDLDDDSEPALLVPVTQQPARFMTIAVRVHGDPMAYAPRLAEHMRAVDADTPLYWVRAFDRILELSTFGQRMLVRIFGMFGLIALLLAAAGLYGVIAYNVGARTREIGVRRALGAPDTRVVRAVLSRSAWQLAIGLVIGLALGVPFASFLAGIISTPGVDALSVVVTAGVLVAAAVVAAVLPTLRALRVDPIVALRND